MTAACGSGSHPPKSQPTTSAPAGSASPSSGPGDFSVFAGSWSGHGGGLTITSDGSFKLGKRIYISCDQAPMPCDSFAPDGGILDGDRASGQLSGTDGTTATGTVTDTTDPSWLPTGPISMTLTPSTDSISIAGTNFCGPNAPAGTCGA
ncbi:hypothetical protein [Kitasatospora acidiphila]|uniref:hypothetical protein n=1 Tax=Kitasatospora acidiphila TaxID=2567942 RepID=UPI0015EFFF58|nr:hypothetical protein [Kitasatospora acidiphila]